VLSATDQKNSCDDSGRIVILQDERSKGSYWDTMYSDKFEVNEAPPDYCYKGWVSIARVFFIFKMHTAEK
jgi:hypothetical protein